MEKRKEQAVVLEQTQLTPEIYSMWLQCASVSEHALPGQFISMYCKDQSHLLPRPISICEINREQQKIRVVYRVVGEGTKEFSKAKAGDAISIIGPLGNGFPLKSGKAILVGGGIGIPPMLELAKALSAQESSCGTSQKNAEIQIVLGYRDSQFFLKEELEKYGTVYVSTDDGSAGTKGTVLDAIREHHLTGDVLYACGPLPMLRGIQTFAKEQGIEAWISMEERMACGIGACLACVCKSTEQDPHSQVHNKRVCKEGPVFLAQEVVL